MVPKTVGPPGLIEALPGKNPARRGCLSASTLTGGASSSARPERRRAGLALPRTAADEALRIRVTMPGSTGYPVEPDPRWVSSRAYGIGSRTMSWPMFRAAFVASAVRGPVSLNRTTEPVPVLWTRS